eukprot:CAMPEP_0178443548 /NCGR_PEP_ID=MMETSP0689_2-20121128/38963_1 /TAXON_ID=160604 /ORGANISM="Amphidinium massartii, Strain CS-259" /LENGTH=158 /DNA_ID=CAMNT_0020067581 /DNA_START=130 /DNA_END=602 /DNA_ORIENTATION=+
MNSEYRFADSTKQRSQALSKDLSALEGIRESQAASRRVSIIRSFTNTSLGSKGSEGGHAARPRAMFNYAESMKSEVRRALNKETYDVRSMYRTEGIWQRIARSHYFENITLTVIALNALWISVDTDLNKATSLMEADLMFQIAEHFFCVYFSFEWIVR